MTPSPNQPPTTLGQFLPLSIIRMIWKQRLLIICGCFLLTSIAAVYIKGLPNIYRADAVIIVDSQKIPEKFVSSTVQATLSDSMSSISQQVLNSVKLEEVIREFDLYPTDRKSKAIEEVVAQFRKDLPITLERSFGGGRPSAFRISFEGSNAPLVVSVVNRVADMFVHENRKTRESRAEGTSDFMSARMTEAQKSLDRQESNLSQFKLKWAGELPQQEPALLGALNRLEVELQGNREAVTRAQQSKILLESTLRFAESSLAAAMRIAEPSPFLQAALGKTQNNEAVIAPIQLRSALLRSRLATLRRRYQDDHTEVRRLRNEIEEAVGEEQEAAKLAAATVKPKPSASTAQAVLNAGVSPQLVAEINRERERIANTKTQLELIEREFDAKNAERQRIIRDISDYQHRVEALPIREQQMGSLTRDYENTKAEYRSLLDKKMSAEMAADMERQGQSERFTITDPARLPEGHVKPRRMVMYLGSALGSLLLCSFIGLAIELRKNTFLGEWELPPQVKVIGRISLLDGRALQGATKTLLTLALTFWAQVQL